MQLIHPRTTEMSCFIGEASFLHLGENGSNVNQRSSCLLWARYLRPQLCKPRESLSFLKEKYDVCYQDLYILHCSGTLISVSLLLQKWLSSDKILIGRKVTNWADDKSSVFVSYANPVYS